MCIINEHIVSYRPKRSVEKIITKHTSIHKEHKHKDDRANLSVFVYRLFHRVLGVIGRNVRTSCHEKDLLQLFPCEKKMQDGVCGTYVPPYSLLLLCLDPPCMLLRYLFA